MGPEREYYESFRITRSRPTQLSSGFKPLRVEKSRGQESRLFTIAARFQEKTKIKGKEQYDLQTEEERSRPNDPEVVGLSEGSTQKQQIITMSKMATPDSRCCIWKFSWTHPRQSMYPS
ncbi:hypothetical protein O181_074314, partial [Austropuccinia psidii MF-1]|nr:hypothetical protein [Austropuccinia psidii MF-1]